MAEWLAGAVPFSASVVNARYISSLAHLFRAEVKPRSSYTPKKSAVCLNFRRQVMERRQDRSAIGIEVAA
ncbi:hypothetical protein HYPDE_34028 [Hyphomicrobium denitrificans 1NES1]|uniref:Uncharacterized protein n=1 Tax=Hyphomicrobium denitrificans 1NES1 TaxID=670307 RepID=N0B646_9HYPH|nr:hypothetical protein HYPDE_34028 [Hyphomicrobium denitrificans 1NES1]